MPHHGFRLCLDDPSPVVLPLSRMGGPNKVGLVELRCFGAWLGSDKSG